MEEIGRTPKILRHCIKVYIIIISINVVHNILCLTRPQSLIPRWMNLQTGKSARKLGLAKDCGRVRYYVLSYLHSSPELV